MSNNIGPENLSGVFQTSNKLMADPERCPLYNSTALVDSHPLNLISYFSLMSWIYPQVKKNRTNIKCAYTCWICIEILYISFDTVWFLYCVSTWPNQCICIQRCIICNHYNVVLEIFVFQGQLSGLPYLHDGGVTFTLLPNHYLHDGGVTFTLLPNHYLHDGGVTFTSLLNHYLQFNYWSYTRIRLVACLVLILALLFRLGLLWRVIGRVFLQYKQIGLSFSILRRIWCYFGQVTAGCNMTKHKSNCTETANQLDNFLPMVLTKNVPTSAILP